jgi:Uma2 family endonuclease
VGAVTVISNWETAGIPWTEERWLAIGETSERIELFDGSILVSPAPTPRHQDVSHLLHLALRGPATAVGLRVYEAVNLRLRTGRITIPDVVIIDPVDRRKSIIDVPACHLVCEIVSPSNPAADRVLKMHYYAQAGIPWYLLVDPEPEIMLTLYRLEGDKYIEVAGGVPGESITLTEPVRVTIDPADLDED